jgi:hypothetical protein
LTLDPEKCEAVFRKDHAHSWQEAVSSIDASIPVEVIFDSRVIT